MLGPTEEGWVIQLTGFHYYNKRREDGFEAVTMSGAGH